MHEGKHSKQPPPKIQRNRFFDCYSYWTRVWQGFDNSKAHVLGLCGHTLGDDTYIKLNVYIEYVFFQPSGCYVTKKTQGKANIIGITIFPDRNLSRRFRDVNELTPMRARVGEGTWLRTLPAHTLRASISKVSGREWPCANARARVGEGTWLRTLPAHTLRATISKVSGREWPYANARAHAGEGTWHRTPHIVWFFWIEIIVVLQHFFRQKKHVQLSLP